MLKIITKKLVLVKKAVLSEYNDILRNK